MSHDTRFWNRFAKRYAATPVADPATYREKLRRTQALLTAEAQLLEVGCGTGSTALDHAPHVAHILATDLSEQLIDIAETKAAAARVTNVTFRCAALDEVPAEDGPFDMVLALNLLHVVSDPELALVQLARHLRPGGHLVTSTLCIGDEMPWMRYIAPLGTAAGVFPTLQFFRRAELETWITAPGLEIIDAWKPKGRGKAVFHIAKKPEL